VSGRDDYRDEMRPVPVPLDDAGAEALLAGAPGVADDQLAGVSAFISEMRACASMPAPPPSPALAALLRDGSQLPSPATVIAPRPHRAAGSLSGWRRRLAVSGLGLGVALTGVVGAGAAGLLPEPAEHVVADLVEALTPLHLPDRSDGDRDLADRPGGPASVRGGDGIAPGSTVAGGGAGTGPGPTTGPVRQPGDVAGTGAGPGGGAPLAPGPAGGSAPGVSPPGVTTPPAPGVGPAPTVPTTLPVAPPTIPLTTPAPPSVTGPASAIGRSFGRRRL
jgi:hypothetical protein